MITSLLLALGYARRVTPAGALLGLAVFAVVCIAAWFSSRTKKEAEAAEAARRASREKETRQAIARAEDMLSAAAPAASRKYFYDLAEVATAAARALGEGQEGRRFEDIARAAMVIRDFRGPMPSNEALEGIEAAEDALGFPVGFTRAAMKQGAITAGEWDFEQVSAILSEVSTWFGRAVDTLAKRGPALDSKLRSARRGGDFEAMDGLKTEAAALEGMASEAVERLNFAWLAAEAVKQPERRPTGLEVEEAYDMAVLVARFCSGIFAARAEEWKARAKVWKARREVLEKQAPRGI